MKKILSIAIAAYNVEKTIEETLEPFLKCRELDKMEVIIVNDGSKDKTPFVVKKYIDQFPNTFVLINKKKDFGCIIIISMVLVTSIANMLR